MEVHNLTNLTYSEDRRGPLWRLYLMDNSGERGEGILFRNEPEYPDEVATEEAEKRAGAIVRAGGEVRVVNLGDMVVYHARDRVVLHGATFWKEIGKAA